VELAEVKRVGYTGIVRYLADQQDPHQVFKIITVAEYQQAQRLGLEIRLVWETTADRPCRSGAAGGREDSAEANRQADVLGYPKSMPIYYACDHDCHPGDWPECEAYLRACSGRPPGLYGPRGVIEHMLTNGASKASWQAGGANAWYGNGFDATGTNVSHLANLYQRALPTLPIPDSFYNTDHKPLIDEEVILRSDVVHVGANLLPFPQAMESAMYSFCVGLDGVRKDAVWVNPDGSVGHGWSRSGNLRALDGTENLGGQAKSVCAAWETNGNFTVAAHGSDDHPFLKVSDGRRWLTDWIRIDTALHPPV
jgi:hypothetical protein